MTEEKNRQTEPLEEADLDTSEDSRAAGGETAGAENEEKAQSPDSPEAVSGAEDAAAEDAAAEEADAEEAVESGEEAQDEKDPEAAAGENGEEGGEAEEGEEEKAPKGKAGFFGRKEKKELAKKEAEITELKAKYLRTLAEYDNFRKRTEKEKSDIYAYAVRDVFAKILPVLDNLERGVAAIPEESREEPVAVGMEKIVRQFEAALADIGVVPMDAAGKPFDPSRHTAVMHVEDENLEANVVAEELMKGYTYRDTVVRPSMVKVAN